MVLFTVLSLWWLPWSPRDDTLRTPLGPEGSNGSNGFVRRGVAFGAAALIKTHMTYQALARTWRPRTFSQVIGQESVVHVLTNSLDKNRLHHAYLLTGTRGVGKTSIARLFAKAMNCERGSCSEPCLECSSCVSIEQGCCIDLLEMDAASHTGVDYMRDLLENVQYKPAKERFKIYLIDEVHMLSTQSFNALLKTLEEPPEHVKFLLATTDPQKLPKTVLSRCIQLHLQHVPAEIIFEHLRNILDKESIEFELEALNILAKAAKGSVRDALSLLDQAIATSSKLIGTADVKCILGYTQQDYALKLLQALYLQEADSIHELVEAITKEGSHFLYVLDETLSYLHEIAIYQTLKNKQHSAFAISEPIQSLADMFNKEDVQLFYQIALKGSEEIHMAPTMSMGFHMIFLRMFSFKLAGFVKSSDLKMQNQIKASMVPSEENLACSVLDAEVNRILQEKSEAENNISSLASEPISVPVINTESSWSEIIKTLKLQGMALHALQQAAFGGKKGTECLLTVTSGHHSLFTTSVCTRIQQALSNYYGESIRLAFNIEDEVLTSPAKQQQQQAEQNQLEAEKNLEQDPIFQQIQKEFAAELVKNSIKGVKNEI